MRLKSFELIEKEGYTYRAEVFQRSTPKWKFWDKTERLVTYVGNSLGWYNPATGAKLANGQVETLLANEMRRIYLSELLAEHNKPNLKPVK